MDKNVERSENRAGVRDFSNAMLDKLEAKLNDGRYGWHDPAECSIEHLCVLLADHIRKGDMVDIGNLAMMIWNRQRAAKEPDK